MAVRASEQSDGDLIGLVREGDQEAYGELWRRHWPAGVEAARRVTQRFDPDDLAQEAFARILHALRTGHGPTGAFRPYLYTTIRHVAASWGTRGRPTVPLDELAEDHLPPAPDDSRDAVAETGLLGRAFAALPTDWSAVLWYTEVEQLSPADTGRLLGLRPAAVSSLAYRAREGLRREWLQAHVARLPELPECRWVAERIGDYHRDALGLRPRRRFEAHLESCPDCPVLVAEVGEEAAVLVRTRLRGLLPLLLLGPGAAALPGTAAGPRTRRRSRPGRTALVAAVAVLAAVAVALAAVTPRDPADSAPPAATAQSPSTSTAEPTPVIEPAVDEPSPQEPGTEPTAVTVPAPPVTVAAHPLPVDIVDTEPVTTEPVTDPVLPVDPEPTEPTEPTVRLPAAPVVVEVEHDPHYLPVLTGTAEPGAQVLVHTTAGDIAGQALADQDGQWRIVIRLDSALAGAAITLTAVQVVDGVTSAPGPTQGPFATEGPTLLDPEPDGMAALTDLDGDGLPDDISVIFDGVPGLRVEAAVDGVATGNLHLLTGTPLTRMVRDLAVGEHTFAVRYVDPDTGRAGAWTRVGFTAAVPLQVPDPASGNEPNDPPGGAPVPVLAPA